MPPSAFSYPPNQVHDMRKFGPICKQRWPLHFAANNLTQASASTRGEQVELTLKLARRLMPGDSFAHFKPLFKRLIVLEQSEDCLNLNIYAPLEGKLACFEPTLTGRNVPLAFT